MKKLNNKGFSLVELIVVIAIMAILAVTLAPRLVQYVERSREAADREVAHTVMTALKLADLEDPLDNEETIDLATDVYTVSGKEWTLNSTHGTTLADGTKYKTFYITLEAILGDFTLKSTSADDATLVINKSDTGALSVELDLDGATGSGEVYTVK